ncbi:MAG: Lrp/AsnC family transcriptional regulator [Gammaproteobacteria bacterium]
MDDVDRRIINTLQNGFPLSATPYLQAAERIGISEAELLQRLQTLLDGGILTRFGPLYHAEQMGGALTLAALKAPPERFEDIAAVVNAFPEVAHNYQRSHELNMWFVIATEKPERQGQVIAAIEAATGLTVFNFPKIAEYFVHLHLEA